MGASTLRIAFMGDLTADIYVDQNMVKLGGGALNSAIWTKRAGATPHIISAVSSDDPAGKFFTKFRQLKLSPDGVQKKHGDTSAIEIFVGEGGKHRYGAWNPGVLTHFHLRPKDWRIVKSCDGVIITPYPQYAHVLDEFAKLKSSIKTNHQPLFVVNFGDMKEFHDDMRVVRESIRLADVFMFGLDKDTDEKMINELHDLARDEQKLVVITLGQYGSVASDKGRVYTQIAKKVKVKDTTGAGDAFLAGFLVSYLKTRSVATALKRGTDLAARAIQKVGAY